MDTFKSVALQVLRDANKPLHINEITEIGLANGLLKTSGKTPKASMSAALSVDVRIKKEKSQFIKVSPSIFYLNTDLALNPTKEEKKIISKISPNISTQQKGNIAEARIAELITLYGEENLSCYKPISDDDGIDLIVKQKRSLNTMYIQIKSRFDGNGSYTANAKAGNVLDSYSVAMIFCHFDTSKGEIDDFVWFVPAPDFIKEANKLNKGKMLGFVAGRSKKPSNKWDKYSVHKHDLANHILAHMKRT